MLHLRFRVHFVGDPGEHRVPPLLTRAETVCAPPPVQVAVLGSRPELGGGDIDCAPRLRRMPVMWAPTMWECVVFLSDTRRVDAHALEDHHRIKASTSLGPALSAGQQLDYRYVPLFYGYTLERYRQLCYPHDSEIDVLSRFGMKWRIDYPRSLIISRDHIESQSITINDHFQRARVRISMRLLKTWGFDATLKCRVPGHVDETSALEADNNDNAVQVCELVISRESVVVSVPMTEEGAQILLPLVAQDVAGLPSVQQSARMNHVQQKPWASDSEPVLFVSEPVRLRGIYIDSGVPALVRLRCNACRSTGKRQSSADAIPGSPISEREVTLTLDENIELVVPSLNKEAPGMAPSTPSKSSQPALGSIHSLPPSRLPSSPPEDTVNVLLDGLRNQSGRDKQLSAERERYRRDVQRQNASVKELLVKVVQIQEAYDAVIEEKLKCERRLEDELALIRVAFEKQKSQENDRRALEVQRGEETQTELDRCQSQQDQFMAASADFERRLNDTVSRSDEYREALDQSKCTIANLQAEKKLLEEIVARTAEEIRVLGREHETLLSGRKSSEEALDQLQNLRRELEAAQRIANEKQIQLEKRQIELFKLKAEIQGVNNDAVQMRNEQAGADLEASVWTENLQIAKARLRHLESELPEKQREIDRLAESLDEHKAIIKRLEHCQDEDNASTTELKARLAQSELLLLELAVKVEAKTQQLADCERSTCELRAKNRHLEEQIAALESRRGEEAEVNRRDTEAVRVQLLAALEAAAHECTRIQKEADTKERELRLQLEHVTTKHTNLEARFEQEDDRATELEKTLASVREDAERSARELAELVGERDALIAEQCAMRESMQQLTDDVVALKKQLDNAQIEHCIAMESLVGAKQMEQDALQHEIKAMQEKAAARDVALESLELQLQTRDDDCTLLEQRVRDKEIALQSALDELLTCREADAGVGCECQALRSRVRSMECVIVDLETSKLAMQAELVRTDKIKEAVEAQGLASLREVRAELSQSHDARKHAETAQTMLAHKLEELERSCSDCVKCSPNSSRDPRPVAGCDQHHELQNDNEVRLSDLMEVMNGLSRGVDTIRTVLDGLSKEDTGAKGELPQWCSTSTLADLERLQDDLSIASGQFTLLNMDTLMQVMEVSAAAANQSRHRSSNQGLRTIDADTFSNGVNDDPRHELERLRSQLRAAQRQNRRLSSMIAESHGTYAATAANAVAFSAQARNLAAILLENGGQLGSAMES